MSAGYSGAEICSTVFGSEYCLLYNDPGLNYAEFKGSTKFTRFETVTSFDITSHINHARAPHRTIACIIIIMYINLNPYRNEL